MWEFDAKSILIACFVAGGKVLYDKVVGYMTKNQYIDRGIVPKWDQLTILDNQIPVIAQQYQDLTINVLDELTNFTHIYKEVTPNLHKSFTDFLFQKVLDEDAVISEDYIKYDEFNNLVWMVTDPNDMTPIESRRVIFMNTSICDFESGSEKAIQGFITQLLTTKMLKETIPYGSLKGSIVICSVSYDYHMPYHIFDHTKYYPDAIVICEPTGSCTNGPLGFAIAQKGEVKANISVSGTEKYKQKLMARIEKEVKQVPNPSTRDPFLGKGKIEVDHNAPTNEGIIVKRTLTFGETAEQAMNEIDHLPIIDSIKHSPKSIAITRVEDIGAWKTPRDTRALLAATEAYRRTVSPWATNTTDITELRIHPFFTEREQSDNFSGYPARVEIPQGFEWDDTGDGVQPPTFGIGAGYMNSYEENVEPNHLQAAASVLSRFPSLFAKEFDHSKDNEY